MDSAQVLLVEDSAGDASLVRAALEEPGGPYRIHWVDTLDAATTALRETPYECVLLDLGLPDADGLDVVDAILDVSRETAVVVLTGRGDDALGVPALQRGAADYLLKSEISTRALRRALDHAVERTRSGVLLRRMSRRTHAVLTALGDGLLILDPAGHVTTLNPAAARMTGCGEDAVSGVHLADVPWRLLDREGQPLPPADRPELLALADGHPHGGVLRLCAATGDFTVVEVDAYPMNRPDGVRDGVVVSLRDVSDRERAQETARLLSAIVESTADAIITTGLDGTITTWNRGAEELYGYVRQDVVGASVGILDPSGSGGELAAVLSTVASGETVRGLETTHRRRTGTSVDVSLTVSPVFGEGGAVVAGSVIARDISDRRALERELTQQAMHDTLTGLPNRTLLGDRLAQAIADSARHGAPTAVLFLDLDQFKTVNDANGHLYGDQLLVEVAGRLRAAIRPSDTVARFGGDEFVIVCGATDEAGAESVAARVGTALDTPVDLDGQRVYVSASIGIAVTPPLEADADTLLRYADAAMYDAKARGRARARVFDVSLARQSSERLEHTNELREALAADALEVHYQPVVDLTTGRLRGVEALARWNSPTRGAVPPALFVPLAEESGLIETLDRYVLERACRDAVELRESGVLPPDACMAVNVSARTVGDGDLVEAVRTSVRSARLPFDALELEVTETGLMADAPTAREVLQALRALGVGVALDDFGTGYSSLTYLRQLPVTTLKIDRLFVQHITDRPDDLAIAASVTDLARTVGLRTVAEGVESSEQLLLLQRLGCTSGQGYLWSPPVPLPRLRELLQRVRGQFPTGAPGAGPMPVERRSAAVATDAHGLHRLLELHRDGASLATIAAALNAEGYRNPSGQRWHGRAVARVVADVAANGSSTSRPALVQLP